MQTASPSQVDVRPVGARVAFGVLLLWLVYTTVYTLPIAELPASLVHLLPGLTVVALLRYAGFSWDDCFLTFRPLSVRGLGALALVTLALAGPLLTSDYAGVRPLSLLLLAPAGALAQELYFRAGLLPLLLRLLPRRPRAAILLHALLFGLWHVPNAVLYSPINPVLGGLLLGTVTSLAGLGWGWQVHHDQTAVWSFVHHWVLLSVMSLFGV